MAARGFADAGMPQLSLPCRRASGSGEVSGGAGVQRVASADGAEAGRGISRVRAASKAWCGVRVCACAHRRTLRLRLRLSSWRACEHRRPPRVAAHQRQTRTLAGRASRLSSLTARRPSPRPSPSARASPLFSTPHPPPRSSPPWVSPSRACSVASSARRRCVRVLPLSPSRLDAASARRRLAPSAVARQRTPAQPSQMQPHARRAIAAHSGAMQRRAWPRARPASCARCSRTWHCRHALRDAAARHGGRRDAAPASSSAVHCGRHVPCCVCPRAVAHWARPRLVASPLLYAPVPRDHAADSCSRSTTGILMVGLDAAGKTSA
jgi:hypothetical protein